MQGDAQLTNSPCLPRPTISFISKVPTSRRRQQPWNRVSACPLPLHYRGAHVYKQGRIVQLGSTICLIFFFFCLFAPDPFECADGESLRRVASSPSSPWCPSTGGLMALHLSRLTAYMYGGQVQYLDQSTRWAGQCRYAWHSHSTWGQYSTRADCVCLGGQHPAPVASGRARARAPNVRS